MYRIISIFLFLLLPVTAFARCEGTDLIDQLPANDRAHLQKAAAATPYPQGLLWQAKRDKTVITLFGTYHFAHDRTDEHLKALKPLIGKADAVYLEVSNADQKTMEKEILTNPSMMFITEGPSLIDLLGEDDWQRLSAEMAKRDIPSFLAAKFKPMWASLMLGIGPCETRENQAGAKGIDHKIGEYAASRGKASRSLEDFRTLLTLFDELSIEDQLDMIRLFLAWDGDADDLAYTLRQRYIAQEIALLWEYSRFISEHMSGDGGAEDFKLLEERLLDGRNQGWMDVLLNNTRDDEIFVAVGAAHLPGKSGLLYLLEQEGFSIERLSF